MKDALDHSNEPLPVRRSHVPPAASSHLDYQDDYADSSGGQHAPHGKRFSVHLIWKALKRHGAIAFPIWVLASLGAMYLAYLKIKPTFEASSAIQIQRGDTGIFANNGGDLSRDDFATYIQTQVNTVTSPTVIETALTKNPELVKLPMLINAKEPIVEIKKNVKVVMVPLTNLIVVQLTSQFRDETALIVNAVVDAYLEHTKDTFEESTSKRIDELKITKEGQIKKVDKLRTEISGLMKAMGDSSRAGLTDRNIKTLDSVERYNKEFVDVNIKQVSVQAKLNKLRSDLDSGRNADQGLVNEAIANEIAADSRFVHLEGQIADLQTRYDKAWSIARKKSDPTVSSLSKKLEGAKSSMVNLRKKLEPGVRQRVLDALGNKDLERTIAEVQSELEATKIHADTLDKLLMSARVETKDTESQELKIEFVRSDMNRADNVLNTITDQLSQLEYNQKSQIARVDREYRATPSLVPSSERRNQAIAIAPVAIGLGIVFLLVLLELRGGRVGDPEELSSRMNLQVIGVVPPLPQIRSGVQSRAAATGNTALMTNSEMKAQRQLDEFVQSLDHLRVALCARKDPWGRDKHCVLITSACGSEGKTTLAAQLAERCVNAGLMTLLIDADLRNPTLSRMLDAFDSPGLINVLRGEVLAEDVVTVIGDAGGFHLLPAGTPKMDPSRLLQSDRLGKLIAQARESFDMIIVDAPPVLPVPDALTIGKWTDGAVLAVRYDTSRFPLVERANRRLAHVGVPVIGAVVNGVRSMESAYGGYYAYGGYGSNAPTAEPAATSEE